MRNFGVVYVDEFDGLTAHEIAALVALRSFGDADHQFPSHRALAKRAGMAVSTLQRALRSLRDKGKILWSMVLGTSNRYRVRDAVGSVTQTDLGRSQGPMGSVTQTDGVGHTDRGGSVTQTDKAQNLKHRTETPKHRTAPVARGGGKTVQVGNLEPDEVIPTITAKIDTAREGTHAWCYRRFENGAKSVGHPRFNQGVVHRTIKELRTRYTYDQIDRIIQVFFLRHEATARGTKANLALVFRNHLPQVEKEAGTNIPSSSSDDYVTRHRKEQDRILAIMQRGQHSA